MKQKIKHWLKRYLPAEIVGTITAIMGASGANFFSDNLIFIAYVGSFSEALGFYVTVFIQNILTEIKRNRITGTRFSFSDFWIICSNIIFEFGPAGLVDGLLLRPFFLYFFPILIKNFTIGVLVGKIVGDFAFYILVIISYEIAIKHKNKN
jgi:hypothetical protein